MVYLKIIFYGILAFIERHPLFTMFIILVSIFAPVVWKAVGWVIVAVLFALLILVGIGALRIRKMRREVEDQFRGSAGGFTSGGFSSGFSSAQGMSLEELVRRMQAEADAQRRANSNTSSTTTTSTSNNQQRRVNDKVGDYVDFEEIE